jgi:hypothetical protein
MVKWWNGKSPAPFMKEGMFPAHQQTHNFFNRKTCKTARLARHFFDLHDFYFDLHASQLHNCITFLQTRLTTHSPN